MKIYVLHLESEKLDKLPLEEYLPYVSKDRRERLERLKNRKVVGTSLGAGLLISLAYGEREVQEKKQVRLSFDQLTSPEMLAGMQVPRISIGAHGKPAWEDPNTFFNLSHSGEFVILVEDTVPVGCDIQKVVQKDVSSIAKRFYGPKEQEQMEAKGFEPEDFFSLWCAKESFGKYTGSGLQEVLEQDLEEKLQETGAEVMQMSFQQDKDTYYIAICKERESMHETNFSLFEGV